ncbi:MAG: 2-oxo acid dehydrogenase subunit E2 [Propionibacteriaceae bacterium]|nr:2-oxo acid dehydrogenase subunit E2 [Propionibacteriaceae bacterium]
MSSLTIHKRRSDRYDATRVKVPYNLNAIFPYLMKGRNESVAYYPIDVDVENLMTYIEENKGTDQEITIFQAVLLALVKVLRERPTLNRYFIGRRLYQRRDVVFSFIAKKKYSDDAEEANVLLRIQPQDSRENILSRIRGEIRSARTDAERPDDKLIGLFLHLPRSLLRLAVKGLEWFDFYVDTPGFLRGVDPLRCSVYIANLGSIGLDAPYHHLYEWGTCSIFLTIGKIHPAVVVGEDGQPAVRRVMNLRVSLDERIADGYYDARSLDLLGEYLAHPAMLETL